MSTQPFQQASPGPSNTHAGLRAALVLGAMLLSSTLLVLSVAARPILSAPSVPSTIVDQDGVAVTLAHWRGRVVILDFFYTVCTGACPVKTLELTQVQRLIPRPIRDQVEFVSISIDPENDDPAILRAYAVAYGADLSNWAFLTGSPGLIRALAAEYDVFRPGETATLRHTTDIRLLDPAGNVVQRYNGLSLDVSRLAREAVQLVEFRLPMPPKPRGSIPRFDHD